MKEITEDQRLGLKHTPSAQRPEVPSRTREVGAHLDKEP